MLDKWFVGCQGVSHMKHSTQILSTNLMRATNELLRIKEGLTLTEWLTEQRGHGSSYATISQDLYTATGDTIRVTGETIRQYCVDLGIDLEAAS